MEKLEELVERVTNFFCKILPASKFSLPPTEEAVCKAFKEAEFCYQASSMHVSAPAYRPIIEELEIQYPLSQAPKMLFLSLCDNVKLSSAFLKFGRQVFDRVSAGQLEAIAEDSETELQPDLESWLCENQRARLREQWVKVNSVLRSSSSWGWGASKSHLWWSGMALRPESDISVQLIKALNEGRLDKILHGLLLQDTTFDVIKLLGMRVLRTNLKMRHLSKCEIPLLSKVCDEKLDFVEVLVTCISNDIKAHTTTAPFNLEETVNFLQSLLKSVETHTAVTILNLLEKELRYEKYWKAELINSLVVSFQKQ